MTLDIQIERTRNDFRRITGNNEIKGVLGDGNGIVNVSGQPGKVYVRLRKAENFSAPFIASTNGTVSIQNNRPVTVTQKPNGEYVVNGIDIGGMVTQGVNPLEAHNRDPQIDYFTSQSQITTLLCYAAGTDATAALAVIVREGIIVRNGASTFFSGERVDLTSSVPGTAGHHAFAVLLLDTTDSVEVQVSTSQATSSPLDMTDISEAIANASAGAIPVWAWVLENGQTNILASNDNVDLRQFVNPHGATFDDETFTSITVRQGAVFNNSGGSFDFQVQSAANTHMLFVDGSADNIGINNATPAATLDLVGTMRQSSGNVLFNVEDDAVDFTIRGDTDLELFFVDGSADRVGISTNTPARLFHVAGEGQFDADLRIGDGTGGFDLFLNGAAGQNRGVQVLTSGVQRWLIRGDSTTEGGSDAGTNFRIGRYNDAGSFQDDPFFIERATGFVGIGTTSPSRKLDVRESVSSASGQEIALIAVNDHTGATTGIIQGISGFAIANPGSGNTAAETRGLTGTARLSSAGTLTNAYGLTGAAQNTGVGTLSNAYALAAFAPANIGGGAITNAAAILLQKPTVATNNYYIDFDTADNTDPSSGLTVAPTGRLPVRVGGVLKYIAVW